MDTDIVKLAIVPVDRVTRRFEDAVREGFVIGTVLSIENPGKKLVEAELVRRNPPSDTVDANNTRTYYGIAPRLKTHFNWVYLPEHQEAFAMQMPRLHATARMARQSRQHFIAFWDVEKKGIVLPRYEPQAAHVAWAHHHTERHLLNRPGKELLLHCKMAASRSPALGLAVILAAHEVAGVARPDAEALAAHIATLQLKATPNLLLVAATDKAFGYKGKLAGAVNTNPVLAANRAQLPTNRPDKPRGHALIAPLLRAPTWTERLSAHFVGPGPL